MEIREIKGIIDLMTKNGLTEFELERDNFKIRIKRSPQGDAPQVVYASPSSAPIAGAMPPLLSPTATGPFIPVSQPPSPSPASIPENVREIVSPMVGTFYRSPSPDAPAYVEVGQNVTQDTVVCIIEAMKVMNEIKAETSGIITEVLAENGKPVEFNKALFRVKTS